MGDFAWGKPQQEVIPGHMTMCNTSLGFTMCVDQADDVDCLDHNWDCSKKLAPGLLVPVGYGWECVVFKCCFLSSHP